MKLFTGDITTALGVLMERAQQRMIDTGRHEDAEEYHIARFAWEGVYDQQRQAEASHRY